MKKQTLCFINQLRGCLESRYLNDSGQCSDTGNITNHDDMLIIADESMTKLCTITQKYKL